MISSSLVSRLASPFREFGTVPGALYLADRMLRKVSSKAGIYVYELIVQPITEQPLLRTNLIRNMEFRLIPSHDPLIATMPARPEIKDARFAQGATCFGAFRKGQLVAYLWYCTDSYREDEVRCDYVLVAKHDSVFDFDLYVLPEHRLGVAFAALWQGANAHLRGRGIARSYSRVTWFNTTSRRSHSHLGGKRTGVACFVVLGPLQFMVSTLWPHVRVTWGEGRVRLELREGL